MAKLANEELARWRAAMRAGNVEAARGIRERLAETMKAAESTAPPPRPKRRRRPAAANGSPPDAAALLAAGEWVRLPLVARELGIDERTLKERLAGLPFVKPFSARITLVHRPRLYLWLDALSKRGAK